MEPNDNPPVDLDGFRSAMRDIGADEIVELTLAVYMEEAKSLFSRYYQLRGISRGLR